MLRDCVAVVSLGWMTTFQVQMAMRRLWALKNRTTRDILEELELEKAVTQERDDKYPEKGYLWGATPEGVAFWIRDVSAIPAGIVEAASTARSVTESEASPGRNKK